MEKYLKEAISCHHSWDATCILWGVVDSEQKLIIKDIHNLNHMSIENLANLLKDYEKEIWINKHQPLKEALNIRCEEIDFENEHKSELEPLKDL